ncbi:MAG TPA: cell division protein FtsA [Chthonomonadaceae bacterium]|nr:cell division protein FtsA [Chthonomonadaceae bacterium]
MARNEVITGLDIGTTKICALIAEMTEHGELLITGVGVHPSTGMKKGVVVDIESTTRAVEEAVTKASRQAGREVESVYVGVTGEHIASLNSSGRIAITHPDREVTHGDVERVLEAARVIVLPPDREILHAIPRSYSIDGQNGIRQPVGMSGTRLEVQTHIVHGATTFLQNVEKCVTKAGLEVAEKVLEPIATGEAVLLPAEKELGVCLVDIGGGTSDLAVFVNGEIYYSAVIPVGGNHVTNDVAYGLTVGVDEAERLKTESGNALTELVPEEDVIVVRQIGREEGRKLRRRALVQIIEPRMQELFQLVQDELVKADCLHLIPAGLVLSGGGSQLKGCADIAQQVMGLSVRIGKPQGVGGLGETLTHPMYATAVGLVQYGARQMRHVHQYARTHSSNNGMRGLRRILAWLRDLIGI